MARFSVKKLRLPTKKKRYKKTHRSRHYRTRKTRQNYRGGKRTGSRAILFYLGFLFIAMFCISSVVAPSVNTYLTEPDVDYIKPKLLETDTIVQVKTEKNNAAVQLILPVVIQKIKSDKLLILISDLAFHSITTTFDENNSNGEKFYLYDTIVLDQLARVANNILNTISKNKQKENDYTLQTVQTVLNRIRWTGIAINETSMKFVIKEFLTAYRTQINPNYSTMPHTIPDFQLQDTQMTSEITTDKKVSTVFQSFMILIAGRLEKVVDKREVQNFVDKNSFVNDFIKNKIHEIIVQQKDVHLVGQIITNVIQELGITDSNNNIMLNEAGKLALSNVCKIAMELLIPLRIDNDDKIWYPVLHNLFSPTTVVNILKTFMNETINVKQNNNYLTNPQLN